MPHCPPQPPSPEALSKNVPSVLSDGHNCSGLTNQTAPVFRTTRPMAALLRVIQPLPVSPAQLSRHVIGPQLAHSPETLPLIHTSSRTVASTRMTLSRES
ncbi:unnamed protein product [Protopolystoma xenopodis]|uniref:Uncharacterized protein n=1 Tax=Protopolystoma xenopodis TaxID=117903 RepID=A0A448XRS8_9PLAT|nr:unnamed protein product [Protopolystoma xenopodis]